MSWNEDAEPDYEQMADDRDQRRFDRRVDLMDRTDRFAGYRDGGARS